MRKPEVEEAEVTAVEADDKRNTKVRFADSPKHSKPDKQSAYVE